MTLEEAKTAFAEDIYATETTGIQIVEIGEQYAKCSLAVNRSHHAAGGHVMGGAIFTLADFAFAVASNSGGQKTLTANSSITYLGQPKDNTLIAECTCLRNGRRTCTYEIYVLDGRGSRVAYITTNGMHV